MESNETFTHDELIAALLGAQDDAIDDSGVMTGPELIEALGINRKRMLRRVKILLRAGTIEVGKKRVINTLGIQTTVRGYRLVNK